MKKSKISSVSFTSVPCFVHSTQVSLFLPNIGKIEIDLVCAGGFFAMVNLEQPWFKGKDLSRNQLINLGMSITQESCRQLKVMHPLRSEVSTVDVTEFYRHIDETHGSSIVIYGESHMDRSPCGTGTSAKMALLYSQGLIPKNVSYVNKGPLETAFSARVIEDTKVGSYPAVVVKITGSAHITGLHQFVLDKNDPFPRGFLL
ncbi:MAG: proline racemase family protein [Desulfonatronovibrio sp.]